MPLRAAGGSEANGWMSSLLARASQEDAPRRGKGGDLDSLSADIARMVDENALSQAWDRYRRGDRGADHRRHRRIMCQAFGVVHILIAGDAPARDAECAGAAERLRRGDF